MGWQEPGLVGDADATALAEPIGWFAATVLGIVEGVTEFLPVSSTGHLIVANRFLGASDPAFEVAIQIGAISAIAVLYRERLWRDLRRLFGSAPETAAAATAGRVNLFVLLIIAALPAAVLGLAFDDWIEELLFSPVTVATTLLLGGIAFLWLESWLERRAPGAPEEQRALEDITVRQAFGIGLFQCLALVPGTSRSGATIAGGLILGTGRVPAAEFSFLVGLPILYGACLLKMSTDYERLLGPLAADFTIACVVSFVTAYAVVKPFVRYLQRHTFRLFGWYRIAAGVLLFALIGSGLL